MPNEKPPYDPAKMAMVLLASLVFANVVIVLLATIHCAIIDPADPQCQNRPWGTAVKDTILELAPILITLIMLRK